jgi:hypothetical protein
MREYERIYLIGPAGVLAMACMQTGTRRNTGSPSGDPQLGSTGNSREPGRAVWGLGEAHSTDESG